MVGRPGSHQVLSVVSLVVCLLVASATFGVALPSYSMSTGNSIDVPQRTVTVEGDDYTVSNLGRTPQGEDVQVTVETGDSSYDIYLYKVTSDGVQIEQSKSASGTTTVRFPTDRLSPGSYFAAVYDENILDIVPVVVTGYDMSASFPGSVERGETASVSVSVTRTARTRDPTRVEVVVGDSERSVRVNATQTSDGYTAEVPTDELPAGDYAAYAVALGENETQNGQKVAVGVSDRSTLSVTDPTPTPTEASSGGGGSTGGGGGGAADTPTTSPTTTPANTATPNGTTTTGTVTQTEVTTPSPTVTPTSSPDPTASATPSPTDDGVVTPSSPTATQSPTEGGGPGFGLLAALCALAGVALLRQRR